MSGLGIFSQQKDSIRLILILAILIIISIASYVDFPYRVGLETVRPDRFFSYLTFL